MVIIALCHLDSTTPYQFHACTLDTMPWDDIRLWQTHSHVTIRLQPHS